MGAKKKPAAKKKGKAEEEDDDSVNQFVKVYKTKKCPEFGVDQL